MSLISLLPHITIGFQIQDLGASFHVTEESQNIQQIEPFEGSNKIFIGNDQGLLISSFGSSFFISPYNIKVFVTSSSIACASYH